MENYESLKLQNQLCFPLYSVSNLIIRNYKPLLDELDLTYTQYLAMMALWEKERLNEKELGECLFLKSNTLAPLLKKLQAKRFVSIEKDKKDARNIVISLTEEGRKLKDKAVHIPSSIAKTLHLSQEEAIELYRLLHKVLKTEEQKKMKVYQHIDQLIGKTPLVELSNLEKEFALKAKVYAKVEFFNPAGSVKDRIALKMINDLEERGLLKQGSTIIEPTSGNTGIGLCSVAASRGYRAIIVMPETMSIERRKLMKAYGAEIVLSEGSKGMKGAIEKAEELHSQISGSIIPGQFVNPANPKAHFETTGPEIYEDLDGKVDIFVAGVGTGGTISGVGEYLKSKNPNVKVVAVEPASSPVLSKGVAGPHKIQGIGAGFVPKTLNTEIYDEIIPVENEKAFEYARLIGKKEGFLVGISSGASAYAAILLAQREENEGKNIVCLLPDTGERYLSTALFEE